MKTNFKRYRIVSRILNATKPLLIIVAFSIITSIVFVLFKDFDKVTMMMSIFSFALICSINVAYQSIQIQRNKTYLMFPYKSEDFIKRFFSNYELSVIIFYAIIIATQLISSNFAYAVIFTFLFLIVLNFSYLILDGADPQKQEVKLSLLVLVIFFCGAFGGMFSFLSAKLIDNRDNKVMLMYLGLAIVVISILTFFNRKLSYKRFRNNIMQIPKLKKDKSAKTISV